MKKFFILASLETVCFVIMLYFLVSNFNAKTSSQFAASFTGDYVSISTTTVILIMWFLGVFSGFVYAITLSKRYRDQIEFYARKTEKLSQQNEIDSDDKEALQRKIASLEIALDNALKNK
ncbi:hypothetical protein IJD44_03495 [bacterium]|nr:hypothetical protein [bacterium]